MHCKTYALKKNVLHKLYSLYFISFKIIKYLKTFITIYKNIYSKVGRFLYCFILKYINKIIINKKEV